MSEPSWGLWWCSVGFRNAVDVWFKVGDLLQSKQDWLKISLEMNPARTHVMRTIDPHDVVIWIEEAESCCTTPVPSHVDCVCCSCTVVEHLEFVSVRMTVKLSLEKSKSATQSDSSYCIQSPQWSCGICQWLCGILSTRTWSNCHHPMEYVSRCGLFRCFFQLPRACHEATACSTELRFCCTWPTSCRCSNRCCSNQWCEIPGEPEPCRIHLL